MLAQFNIRSKENILILFLVIFYTVGTVGILLPEYRDTLLPLSPLNLIISFSALLLSRKNNFLPFLLMLLLCFIVGIAVELIGTKTGLLFGVYAYGENLGLKFMGVPWIIGLNWGILIVSTASLMQRLKTSRFVKAVLAALLMTALDVLIEPVAIESDFWSWKSGEIPIYNYICWFFIAFSLQWFNFNSKAVESNKVANSLFIIMTLFFLILNIF
jgi:putative membrane protein